MLAKVETATVRESKERIRSAIKNSQFAWPMTRVTVNLAPADVRKEGSAFDLPIALGLLAASKQLDPVLLANTVVLGELALDGSLRPVPGVLAVALGLRGTGKRFLLPAANAAEAALVEEAAVYPMQHLLQVVSLLTGREEMQPFRAEPQSHLQISSSNVVDFSEVKGQVVAKRAIEVAVAYGVDIPYVDPDVVHPVHLSRGE